MTTTTILFLKSYLSREKFADALVWVKDQPRRLYLPDHKLWALDTETTPEDPAWSSVLESVEGAGWKIVGETLWDADRDLRANQKAIEGLADLAVEREERANAKRRQGAKR